MEKITFQKPVILCVGTINVSGDSVGPKVGDNLLSLGVNAYVYGKSSRPVNGINYERYVEFIKIRHPHSIIIAVDACLGKKTDVGKVKYSLNGLKAGAALKKDLTKFGDLTVLCVVAEKSDDNLRSLLLAEKEFVDELAERTAAKIFALVKDLRLNYADRHKINTTVGEETVVRPPCSIRYVSGEN